MLTLNNGQSGLRFMVQMWLVPPHSQWRSAVYLSLNETTHAFYVVCLLAELEWGGDTKKKNAIPSLLLHPLSAQQA